MAKIAAKGTAIAYLVGSAYTAIAQVRSISYDLGGAADKVDVTTLDTSTNYRDFVSTWLNPGSVELEIVYDPPLASHTWLRTNAGTDQTFRITLPDAGDATETFSASVGALAVEAGADGALVATVSLNILGASAHAA